MFIKNNITSSDQIVNDPKTIILKRDFLKKEWIPFKKTKEYF
jgi:hypothetical protein